ncbi:Adagio protein 3 [Ancistrocladus abbreviatus]
MWERRLVKTHGPEKSLWEPEAAVEPSSCNFSACAVGNRLVMFDGEGVDLQPMDDTLGLDLMTLILKIQTLGWLYFWGCGRQDLLNDVLSWTWMRNNRLGKKSLVVPHLSRDIAQSKAPSWLYLVSGEAYTEDLEEEKPKRTQIDCGVGSQSGVIPTPRLNHVAATMPRGRIIIFGGSIAGLDSPSQPFLTDPSEDKPSSRIFNVPGQPSCWWD